MPAHMRPKPRPGTARAMQRARARLAKTRERAAKDAAKLRDACVCRRCGFAATNRAYIEAAHIRSAGSGGDPTGLRSWKASDYVTLCADCHRGTRSVHSGHVRMLVGPRGGDGVVRFVDQTPGLLVPPIHPAYLLERYDVPVTPLVKPIRAVPIK